MNSPDHVNHIKAGTLVRQFVCFKLAEEEYAIDIQLVQEVIKTARVTFIPQMPGFCLGVINNRGNIIPVFDLRREFGLSERPFGPETRFLVCFTSNGPVALVVDAVLDNVKFDMDKIDPAPEVRMKIDRAYIEGLGELDKRMIVILNLEKMNEFILKEIEAAGL